MRGWSRYRRDEFDMSFMCGEVQALDYYDVDVFLFINGDFDNGRKSRGRTLQSVMISDCNDLQDHILKKKIFLIYRLQI